MSQEGARAASGAALAGPAGPRRLRGRRGAVDFAGPEGWGICGWGWGAGWGAAGRGESAAMARPWRRAPSVGVPVEPGEAAGGAGLGGAWAAQGVR